MILHPRVVHVTRDWRPGVVYVGRRMTVGYDGWCDAYPDRWGPTGRPRRGEKILFPASDFANPFRQYGRDALRLYVDHLDGHPILLDRAIHELRGKTLGCWCRPKLCHGDVLAHLADGRRLAEIRRDLLELFGQQLDLFGGGR